MRGESGGEEARAALSAVLTAALRRTGLPCAPASRPGTAVGSGELPEGRGGAVPLLSLLFFFRPAAKLFVCAGVSAPGNGPGRRPPSPGTKRSQARPDGADGPPHGYRRTRLAPPERLGGVFKVLAAGNGDRGAPGGFVSIKSTLVCLRTLPLQTKTKEYNS